MNSGEHHEGSASWNLSLVINRLSVKEIERVREICKLFHLFSFFSIVRSQLVTANVVQSLESRN